MGNTQSEMRRNKDNFIIIVTVASFFLSLRNLLKMCDMDIIPTTLLKEALPGLLPMITKIVNASMTQGVFPSIWKTGDCQTFIKEIRPGTC